MAIVRSLTCFVVAALLIELATAASYTVGGPSGGWDSTTDLQTWASSQKFSVGDSLVFQYAPSHDVAEVTKADYDSCQSTSPIKTSTGGSTTVSLTSPGKRYFICTTPGHCAGGMKLEVDTLATTSSPPPATPATPPPASATSPPTSPAAPPPRSAAASPPSKSPTASPPAESPLAPKTPKSSPASTPGSAPPSETAAESPKSSASKGSLTFTWVMGVCFGVVSLLAA